MSSSRAVLEPRSWARLRGTPLEVVAVGTLLYAGAAAGFRFVLDFDLLRSDPARYWQLGSSLDGLINEWWLPGYPIVIWVVRTLTFGLLEPLLVLQLICGVSYVAALVLVYRLVEVVLPVWRWELTLFFAVLPIVGLVYAVFPNADSLTTLLLLLAIDRFRRERWPAFALAAACASLTHKASWFWLLPLGLVALLRSPVSRPWVLASALPLTVVWLLGWVQLGSPGWIFGWSVDVLLTSRGPLPVGDAVVGSLLAGGFAGWTKAIAILALAALAGGLALRALRHRDLGSLALTLPVLAMALVVNAYEAMAVLRFSRPLIVAAVVALGTAPAASRVPRALLWSAIAVAFLSNVAFSVYLARSFFA